MSNTRRQFLASSTKLLAATGFAGMAILAAAMVLTARSHR